MFEKSDVLPRDIKYKVDVQTSKLVNDETKYGVFPEQVTAIQNDQQKVETGTFIIHAPTFIDAEQYEFIWDDIKANPNVVDSYSF